MPCWKRSQENKKRIADGWTDLHQRCQRAPYPPLAAGDFPWIALWHLRAVRASPGVSWAFSVVPTGLGLGEFVYPGLRPGLLSAVPFNKLRAGSSGLII
jgi:hypothetical protein